MKKFVVFLLMTAFILALGGCKGSDPHEGHNHTSTPPSTTANPTVTPSFPNKYNPDFTIPDVQVNVVKQTGKLRIEYLPDAHNIKYITSPDQLPDYPELDKYNAAYFETRALVLVTQTVSSGSIQVDISAIMYKANSATVKLNYEMKGDVGTDAMATWLLWVEVDAGLDYNWKLTGVNPEDELPMQPIK